MSTELLSVEPGYDSSTAVERVVEASRRLHDFRTGLAEILEAVSTRACEYMPDHGKQTIEPLLRVLGVDRSQRFAERLYRIASDITAGWQPHIDPDRSTETLHQVIHEAVNAVMAELYRDTCLCLEPIHTATAVRDAMHRDSCVCGVH